MVFRNGKEKKESEETEVQYGADGCYRIFRGDTRGRNTFELPICNQKPIEFIDALLRLSAAYALPAL